MNHFFKYLVAGFLAISTCANAQNIQPNMAVLFVSNESTYKDLGLDTHDLARYLVDVYKLYDQNLKTASGVNSKSEVVLTINISAEAEDTLDKCQQDYTNCALVQTNIEHENMPLQALAQFQAQLEKVKEVKIKNFKSQATATIKIHFTFDDPAVKQNII